MGLTTRWILCGWIGIAAAGFSTLPLARGGTEPTTAPSDSQATEMLLQIESIKPPPFDRSKQNDQAYVQKYLVGYREALNKRKTMARQFVDKFPDNPASPSLLLFVAETSQDDRQTQVTIYRRIQKDYPNSPAAKAAAGPLRQIGSIGKPFELSFTDAISGKKISMADLKGKVVVIDFWATWCGPCVEEMPENKAIYEKYHDKGVQFIGISLDEPESQGGLESLKKFVAENKIPWPQYYQGDGWESKFSSSWGIDSIPTMFIVDANGDLYSTEARGKLDTLIPKLLAKRDSKSSG